MSLTKTFALLPLVIVVTSCASNTPPICYNEAIVMKNRVSVPVFGIRKPLKTTEYLSGGYFGYQWTAQESFTDTSDCDKHEFTE